MSWRKRSSDLDDDRVRERQRERLQIISALVQAQERRDEVLAAIASASDDDEAHAAVAALLGLQEAVQAIAVMDLQLRWMTQQNRERLLREQAELRAALEEGRPA